MAKKKEETASTGTVRVTPRLKERYKNEVTAKLQEQFGYKSSMQLPKLDKIVINMGTGATDTKHLENSVRDLTLISGQKPRSLRLLERLFRTLRFEKA